MQVLLQDLRYGLRVLAKKPTFAVVAVITLALGVGATTAIFSIVNAVLLRRLPYSDPDRLVKITFNNPGVGLKDVPFSVPEFDDLRTRAGVFEEASVVFGASVDVSGAKEAERLELMVTSPNYFSMLGATPQLGRLFGPQDQAISFSTSAVISDELWRRSFGADRNVLGRTIRLDNDPYAIVGVLPSGFRHPGRTIAGDVDIWGTAGYSDDPFPKPKRNIRFLPGAIARLKPGITLAQAQARLNALSAQLRQDYATDYPPQAQWTIQIEPLQEALVGHVRPMLVVLMGAVVLIVLIVSLNIANLLLARASGRQQEMAVRQALGASRARMIRQMLTESMLLGIIGGAAGVLTAFLSLNAILRFVPATVPRLGEVRIDWTVLAFALVISTLTGLVFGLAPALHSARVALSSAIREGARGTGYSTKTGRLRDALIISELAFAVVLMVGAGLLLRTLRQLLQESPGFNPSHVVAANIWLPVPNNPKVDPYLTFAQEIPFNHELLRRMSAIPGVTQAALTSDLPTKGQPFRTTLEIKDHPTESSQDLSAEFIRITPGYFQVMQAPLVRGRSFTDDDRDGKAPVVMIDEATARRFWIDQDPIGQGLRISGSNVRWSTVVGIVKDIKSDGLDSGGVPHIYVAFDQALGRTVSVVLRTSLAATDLEPQIRREVQSIDPAVPVFGIAAMNDVLHDSLAPRRFSADLVGAFAGLALLLASVGIYGLLAYMVGQRSREIGLRMALGAQRGDILKLVLGKGFVLAAAGILAGIFFAASGASMMSSLLYGVRPHDPAVFVGVAVILQVVAVLASWIPALRAAKVNPIVALRES